MVNVPSMNSPVRSLLGVGKTEHPGEFHSQHEIQEEQRLGIQVTGYIILLQGTEKKQ